jgi:pSer/pThr/pTyr-binding forkhead associated (FHA) protein
MALQFGISFAGGDPEYVRVRRWPFRIGRSPKCDLFLPNSSRISRQQAKVVKEADAYLLISLGRNPTYLNGELVPALSRQAIVAGDVIEFPDYTLEVRDTAAGPPRTITATANVQQVMDSTIIERMVASSLGIKQWSHHGIYHWLQDGRGREIQIRHDKIELRLVKALTSDEVAQRLALFNMFFGLIEPRQVSVDVVDPVGVL